MKEEQRRAYGEILQLKQRQRAEVKLKFFLADLKTSPQWPSQGQKKVAFMKR